MLKFLLAALLIVGVYAGIQPYRTVQNLTQALENEDAAAVDRYVDFDAVKENLNEDFAQKMGLETGEPNSFAQTLATAVAATFIRNIVSPETMVTVLKDKARRDRLGLSSSLADIFARGSWQGTSQFVLRNDDGQPAALLTRDGLKWEVTALRVLR